MNQTPFPLPEEFYRFVAKNAGTDPTRLRLDWHGRECGFDVEFAITQIECRRKFARKLPSFVSDPKFIFPSLLAGEQATNEFVARFHASLPEEGKKIIDATAGLGIDSMTFARAGHQVDAIEIDQLKQQCLAHNSEELGLNTLRGLCGDSTRILESEPIEQGDIVFIDPHRRDSKGGRVYGIKDCVPDVTLLLKRWEGKGVKAIIKLSPMLDINQTLKDLPESSRLWAICFKGECKEILVETDDNRRNDTEISLFAIDLDEEGIVSEFECSGEFAKVAAPVINDISEIEPGNYIYIPNAAMMKLGTWGAICARFPGLLKLSGATPLFTSTWYYRSFPGRVLTIDSFVSSSELKKLKGQRFAVIARNYPLSADQLRKKAALREGDSEYLVGAKIGIKSKPYLLRCSLPVE